MTNQTITSQLKPIFRFPLHGTESRQRFLIGSGILLAGFVVPIIPGLIIYGYILKIMQTTAKGEAPSMEPWDDWSGLLGLGFRGAIVNIVFTLPAYILFLFAAIAYFSIFILIPVSTGGQTDPGSGLFSSVLLAMATMFISMAIGFLLLIIGLIPLPASLAHLAVNDQLSAAFRIREWWPILSSNALGYFIAFVIVAGIFGIMNFAFIAMYYSIVLVCPAYLLLIPCSFYALLVGAALFGDTYREGLATLLSSAADSSDLST